MIRSQMTPDTPHWSSGRSCPGPGQRLIAGQHHPDGTGGNGVSTPSLPDQREARTDDSPAVMVRLVPSDPRATAQLLVDAMDHRQAVQVASELLELLKRKAEPKHAER